MSIRMVESRQQLWGDECGCPKPSIYFSKEFECRMCQNCGVILTSEDSIPAEKVASHNTITADYFGQLPNEVVKDTMEDLVSQYTQTFVHLRVHTHLSFLKATCKPDDLIKKAKEYGMPALAKTEFGNMCGAPTFVKDCQKEGIKPILGVEFDVKVDVVTYPITFIAMNRNGYKQLVKMTTTAWCEHKTKDGVFITDVDIPVSQDMVAMVDFGGDFNLAGYMLNVVKPRMETYIEVNTTRQEVTSIVNQVSQQTQTPVLVTGNVLYTNEDEAFAYSVGRKIGKHADDSHPQEGIDNWFKPSVFYGTFFEYDQLWVKNTMAVAQRVEDYGLVNKEFIIPTYKNEGKEYTDFNETHRQLEMDAWRGIYEKGKASDPAYIERLQYELGVMKDKKFSSYFLLIGEIVSWMKKQGIMVPFGRGSSVGSLVCYALDIITMDPIRWRIPFERFIHSGRKDLPDIDTDISQERRPEVLAHIADVHGKDRVAHIATYQTMALRAAIENVGRALQVPHTVNRDLRKAIPDDVTEWDSLDSSVQEEIKKMMDFKPEWLPIALALTGTAKNLGFHAAGVVVSNDSLGELVPLIPSPEEDGLFGIQYDMHDCEILGLLKLDMLGLRNIDIIQYTVDRVKARYGIDLDIYNLPSDDAATFNLVAGADYVSVFQLDSTGYRRLCRQLKPQNFEHLMALNALFRPGPLESGVTDQYVERRHGRQAATSWHPWLDEVLDDTYQTVLFQEQAMAMSRIIAGFSDVEADKFRKGIGKKIPEIVDACLEDFKIGAMKMPGLKPPPGWTGSLESWINDLTQKLHGYARYMWNRGHSCIKGDSLVLTCDRGLIPIKNINPGEEIWSVRENTGNLFRNRVIDVINNGVKSTIRTFSADGRSLISTHDHRYFTSKHEYKDASELISGDSLKMFYKGASDRNLNIPVAFIADSNKIPFIIGFDNIVGYDVVEGQPNFRSAEHTLTKVSFKQLMSECSRHFSTRPSFCFPSDKLVNTAWINKNILLSESSRYGYLTPIPFIINIDNLLFDFGSYGNHTPASKSYFLDKSAKSCGASFKRDFFEYIFTSVASGMKVSNEFLVNIVEIMFSFTQDTMLGRGILGDIDIDTTIDTFNLFGGVIVPFVTPSTGVAGLMIGDLHYIGASITNDIDFLDHEINPSQEKCIIDVPYNFTIDSNLCEVWDLMMEQDPNYIANGFVVHNCGYGWITYVTAYLEAHYPSEYYASLLDAFHGNNKRLPTLLRSIIGGGKCKVFPPNVNESYINYEVGSDGNIYMGLAAVRNVGKSAPEIVAERNKGGPFTSFINFCQRMPSVNKTAKVNLVKSGAFSWDKMLCDRDKVDNIDVINKWAKKKNKKFDGSKVSPIEIAMKLEGVNGHEYTDLEKSQNERESLNSFITGHPAAIYHKLSNYLERGNVRVMMPSHIANMECEIGESVLLVGMIDYIYRKQTRENPERGFPSRPYLNISMSDSGGSIIINVWWPLCEDLQKILVANEIAMFECVVKPDKFRDDRVMLRVDNAINLTNGLPIQGVFRLNGYDPGEVVNHIGGIVNNISVLGPRRYASIRGRITIPPHILDDAINKFGDDVKYLISMETLDD